MCRSNPDQTTSLCKQCMYIYMCKSREREGKNLTKYRARINTTPLSQLVSIITTVVSDLQWDSGHTGHSVFGVKHTAVPRM